MTKVHFIALADIIRETKPDAGRFDAFSQWQIMRDATADLCAKANPAFKRDRWLDYIAGKCGANGGKVK